MHKSTVFIIQLCFVTSYNASNVLRRHFRITLKRHLGPGRRIIPGDTMAEHACSSFSIEHDNGSEICSPVNSFRGISEYYSMSQLLYYLCICLVQVF